MYHSKEWKGLEKWSYFHHFFHFYNISNSLPGCLFTIRILISCFQTFPILFGIPIISNPKDNQILTAVKYLSDLFVYFSFSPEKVTIGFLLFFDFISIIMTIVAYASDKLIFNWLFSMILHFIYEILSPIVFNLSAATLQKEITRYVLDEKNDFYFVSSLISCIMFFLNFLIVTYSHSDSVYFYDYYFESWSSWNMFFRTTTPSFLLLILPLYDKYEKIGFYVIDGILMLYAIIMIYWGSRIPFLNMFVNMSFLIFDFYILFIAIFHIFPHVFPSLDPSINIPIIIALLIISIPCGEMISHFRCQQFNTILLNSRYRYERRYDEDSDNGTNRLRFEEDRSLEDLEERENEGESELIYPSYLANQKITKLILRHLINNKSQSIEFANFLFEHSTEFDIWFASVRFLILMKVITPEDASFILHIDPKKVSFFAMQPFCDAQYEAIGLRVTKSSARKFLDKIDEIQSSIIKILRFICITIKPEEDQKATHDFIVQYSRACKDYELSSYIFLNHAKQCPSMLRRLSNYYLKLRGDFIQSQLWEQKLSSYRIPLFERLGSRSMTSLTNLSKPAVSSNRVKSQTMVQRIQSNAVVVSSILFCILFVLFIVFAFNRFETSDHNFVISPLVSLSMVHMACYSIVTQSAQMNLSMQIFTSCNNQFLNQMNQLNSTLLWPPESTVNLLSTVMQNVSKCVSNLDQKIDGAKEAIDIWADPFSDADGNNSLQFGVVTLNLLASLMTSPGKCDIDSYNLVDKYISIETATVQPFRNLHSYLLIFCNTVFNDYIKYYEIYCGVFIFFIMAFIIAILVVSIKFEKSERDKFWKVFQDVETKDLKVFQRTLSHVNSRSNILLKHQSSILVTTQDNINGNLSSLNNSRINTSTTAFFKQTRKHNNNEIDSFSDNDVEISETHDNATLNQGNRSHNHHPKISNSNYMNSTLNSFSNCDNDNDNDNDYDYYVDNYNTTSNTNDNNNNDNDDDNENQNGLIDSEVVSKYKVNRFHPQNSLCFIIYSILLIVCLIIVAFTMVIPYKKLRNDFYDFFYDLENMQYIAERMLNVASLTPLLWNQNSDSVYYQGWHDSCFSSIDFNSKRKKDESTTKQLIDYHNEMLQYCQSYINSNYADSTIVFNIIDLAYHNVNEIAYKLTIDGYNRIHFYNNEFIGHLHLIATCVCIINILYTVVFVMRTYAYSIEFDSMKSILMLLPSPNSTTIANLIANFDVPSGSKKKDLDISKFQSRYIIKQSTDAIIVIDSSKNIQDVNKSAIEMLGYNRDQLIGKQIELFISPNDQSTADFFSQLNFINHQTTVAPHYNLHVICAHKKLTAVSCTILFIASTETIEENEGNKPAFALVLRDRTSFNEQEKELSRAKKNVEELLYNILPRVMANKLLSKNGEQLYSKVDRATIIFIAIVNFLDWCNSHTHTEIMELLNVVVTKFDKQISKFPTLVKLKIINGVYMAAGGLFNEVSKNSHEVEAIEFAIRCGRAIRKRNLQVKSNIQLQIGINTGGPIIAGILGSDKPLFDIWGDAVNVSARLETSAPFDTAQTLQETKDSLPPDVYKFTVREKVFLKGKGDATTYVLDLANPYLHQQRNISMNNFSYDSFNSNENSKDKKKIRKSSSRRSHSNQHSRNESSSYIENDNLEKKESSK